MKGESPWSRYLHIKIFQICRPIFYPIWPLCLYGETSVFDTWFEEVWSLTRHGVTQYGSDICYLQYGDLWLWPVPNVTRDDPDKAEWKHHDIHRFIHEAELAVGSCAVVQTVGSSTSLRTICMNLCDWRWQARWQPGTPQQCWYPSWFHQLVKMKLTPWTEQFSQMTSWILENFEHQRRNLC